MKKKTRYFELFILVLIDAKLSPCHRRGPLYIVYKCQILLSLGCRLSSRQSCTAKMAKATSGMDMHDDCKLKFLELKAKRTYRFVVFKIEEKQKQVVVEKVGEPTQSYQDFTIGLLVDECRYAVYDFDFVIEKNCQKSRIFFIAWLSFTIFPISTPMRGHLWHTILVAMCHPSYFFIFDFKNNFPNSRFQINFKILVFFFILNKSNFNKSIPSIFHQAHIFYFFSLILNIFHFFNKICCHISFL